MFPEQVINYIAGDCTSQEEEFVKEWIEESAGRKEEVEKLKRLWKATSEIEFETDAERVWQSLSQRLGEQATRSVIDKFRRSRIHKERRSWRTVVVRVAAVVLVTLGAWGIFQFTQPAIDNGQQEQEAEYLTLTSGEDQQTHYRFSDGSKVVLNSGSQVRYRSDFGKVGRTLHLNGEAYFEVNHDHPHSFVVITQNAQIKDIGTKFNIKAAADRNGTEVAVAEGSVEVSDLKEEQSGQTTPPRRSVLLSQGEKVDVLPGEKKLVIEKADLNVTLAWVNNHLIFESKLFRDVVRQLEDHYDISITVQSEELLDKRITASFQGETAENVLRVLSLSMGAQYERDNREVIFYQDQ